MSIDFDPEHPVDLIEGEGCLDEEYWSLTDSHPETWKCWVPTVPGLSCPPTCSQPAVSILGLCQRHLDERQEHSRQRQLEAWALEGGA